MNDIIERKEKCGDCLHAEVCEVITKLIAFNRNNPAYCKKFRNSSDVAPVRHGRWLWNETGKLGWEQYYICSNCGDKEYWESKFCPNCGAYMRGESTDD